MCHFGNILPDPGLQPEIPNGEKDTSGLRSVLQVLAKPRGSTMSEVMSYEAAKTFIIEWLRRDALLHEQGQVQKIGEGFDEYDGQFPRAYHQLMIAWEFWGCWIDERNHKFPCFYKGVKKETWPQLARHIADQLSNDREIIEPLIVDHFVFKGRPSLFSRIKGFFKKC